MRESGYVAALPNVAAGQTIGSLPWFGSLDSVSRHLKALSAQLQDAEARLASALEDPVERAARWKANAIELNKQPVQKQTADGRLVNFFADGRREDAGPAVPQQRQEPVPG
jgi:hypothetical protein